MSEKKFLTYKELHEYDRKYEELVKDLKIVSDALIKSDIELTRIKKQNEELIADMITMYESCNYTGASEHCQQIIKGRLERIKNKPIEEIIK